MGYKRKKLSDGEWVEATKAKRHRGLFVQVSSCCDCGLTHALHFRLVKGKLKIAAWRDNRTTAALRRHRKYPKP